MSCRKCPQPNTVLEVSNPNPVEAPEGKVALKYVGARQGSFYTGRAPSGTQYRINGRGTWIFVAPGDVEFFTSIRTAGKPDYQARIAEMAVSIGKPAEQEPIELPDLEPVVYMGAMKVEEAKAVIAEETDAVVLRVWRAQEAAREMPRKTILNAIDARMGEL